MDVNSNDRSKVWTPLFFSLVLVAGMVLGFNLRDSLRNKRELSTIIQRNDRLDEVVGLIRNRYVDTINNELLYTDALSGILRSLDPHTVYIPPDDLEGVNDDLEGGFSGIGVEFSIIRDTIEVTNVIDNGPAAHAGVQVGDQVIKVGDTLVAGVNITSDHIIHLLKGKQSSVVNVTFKRVENNAFKQLPITRDIIPVYSVDASLMLDGITGFIKINRFSATTYDEFSTALKKLQQQGAKQLILDLRDNPGGYLEAATLIADNFLDNNKLIVYTQGVHSPRTEYIAGEKGVFENGKLAILIDEGSASASEILAGAVQDWDRGVIVGRRSFGKGLVQKQYDLPDGAALRLTVARYYTPSGRSIQRSFAKGKDAYMEDYEHRFQTGELTGKDSVALADTTRYYTGRHRLVYGGGGIKPDVYVPYDTAHLSSGLISVLFSRELKATIWDYFMQNRSKLKGKTINEFTQSFDSHQLTSNYLAMLGQDMRSRVNALLAKPANDTYFKLQVQAQLARFLFRDNGYYAVSLKQDEVVNKALAVMNTDQYSKVISGQ
ncbi:MAG: carboxyl-terminal protease [Flavipsychrobacter sp.]|nr:carboxyl-terminal protease [Flavipsychrobacter sp.]